MSKHGVIAPSMLCNNNCWMCGGLSSTHGKFVKPILEDVFHELEYMKNAGVVSLSISGGEPTLNKNLSVIVNYAKDLEFNPILIFTNGRGLSLNKIKLLVDSGITAFHVSLHAPNPDIGDHISNAKGSFTQTIEGLKNLTKLKNNFKYQLSISCVPCIYTDTKLDEIVEIALDFSIDLFQITFPIDAIFHSPISRSLIPRMPNLKKCLSPALQKLCDRGVRPCVSLIPPCLYIGYEKYYYEALPQNRRVMVGFHSENNQCKKVKYQDLISEDMCEHIEECVKCLYHGICVGIPKIYLEQYKDYNVESVSINDIASYAQDNKYLREQLEGLFN
ncbi:radical SAM protein [Candidatus Parcubacteria bacterium]|nr:radical SAM protein [Candidatus Parcubacteria bacterium]